MLYCNELKLTWSSKLYKDVRVIDYSHHSYSTSLCGRTKGCLSSSSLHPEREETVPQRPQSRVRKGAQEVGNKQGCNVWVSEANRGFSWLGKEWGQLCHLNTWKILRQDMTDRRKHEFILRPNRAQDRTRDVPKHPDFLAPCLCGLAK